MISRILIKLALQWDSVPPLKLLLQWSVVVKDLRELFRGIINRSQLLNV